MREGKAVLCSLSPIYPKASGMLMHYLILFHFISFHLISSYYLPYISPYIFPLF